MTYPLGWQSWSPPHPVWPYLPRRDYCPIPELSHPTTSPLPLKPPITYWCSWYALGSHLTYSNLLKQAQLIRQHNLPIEYFLIDDGWHFTLWISDLIIQLRRLDLKIGLWYAPYTRHKHLPLYPTIKRIMSELKPDLLKLDFLYTPFFASDLTDDTLPHQTLVKLFTFLSTNYPELYTVACGCPFTPALGRVNAIRVSKDTTFPPPIPNLPRRLLYLSRMRLLAKKYALIPPQFPAHPDPDVRMFSLDNHTTARLWDKIAPACRGIGDNLTHLTSSQIKQARLWLT